MMHPEEEAGGGAAAAPDVILHIEGMMWCVCVSVYIHVYVNTYMSINWVSPLTRPAAVPCVCV